jgi:hypothetical protein
MTSSGVHAVAAEAGEVEDVSEMISRMIAAASARVRVGVGR